MTGAIFALLLLGATRPPAPLAGTVVDATGGVMPGATVVVLDARHQPTATVAVAGPHGEFTFPDLSLPAELQASLAGFRTQRLTATVSPVTIRLELAPLTVIDEVANPRAVAGWHDPVTGATTLTREDLDRVPAITPDESLRVISGFSLFRRSTSRASNPTTHGVTMRGLSASGASRALVLFDGIPLTDGFGGWVTWERVPAAAIDNVRVQRGAMGELFGSDALGGVITLAPPAALQSRAGRGTATFEWASLSTRSAGASGGDAGRARFFGAASWFDTDGFIPLEPSSRGAVDAPQDTTWSNAYGRATFGSTSRLTVSGWGGRDERGNGTVLQRNASHGGTGLARLETTARGFQFSGYLAAGGNRYEQTFTAVGANRATERLTSTQHIDTNVGRVGADVLRAIGIGYVQARYAASGAGSDFSDVRSASTLHESLNDTNDAASLQAVINARPALTIAGGLRGEWRSAGVPGSAAEQHRKSAVVGRVALSAAATDYLSFRAAAATSHRWPTLNELVRDFSAGSTTTVANPNLLPERARSFEAGVDVSGHGARHQQVSVTVFRAVVLDAVANVTTAVAGNTITRQRRNAGEAHSYGAEIDAEARLSAYFRLRASVTSVNAKFRHSQETALEGNWLPQVPASSVAITADALLPGRGNHVASLVIHTTSSQFDDDRNQFRLAAGTQVDARIAGRWAIGRGLHTAGWQLSIENIGNARIETGRTPLVALGQGRAIRFGLTAGF